MTLYDDILKTCGECEYIVERCCAAELKDVPGIVYANDGINTCKIGKNGESLSYMIDILHCPRRTENV